MIYFAVSIWFYIYAFLYSALTYKNFRSGLRSQTYNEIAIILNANYGRYSLSIYLC
jgi:hypothetical protein